MKLEELYADHVLFPLLSVDRIVIRAYEHSMCFEGGFCRVAKTLRPNRPVKASQSWIDSLARRFHHGASNFAAEYQIPVVKRTKRDNDVRLEDLAADYLKRFHRSSGVYLIVKQYELTRVYESNPVKGVANPHYRRVTRRKALVTQYYFYLVDPTWGPMCVKISSHAPFSIQVTLNGHQWLVRQASRAGLELESLDNAIIRCAEPERLQELANNLNESDIRSVCDRWIYRLLPVFTRAERSAIGLKYEYSLAQYELSHNLVFKEPHVANDLFQRLIDGNRRYFGAAEIKTVFCGTAAGGYPKHLNRGTRTTLEGLTTFKIQYKGTVIRQYNKLLGQMIRTELCVNNPSDLGLGRDLSNHEALRAKAEVLLANFEKREQAIYEKSLSSRVLEQMAQPAHLGRSRVPGLRLDNTRVLAVAKSIVGATNCLDGFTNQSLRREVQRNLGCNSDSYSASQLNYDLRKFRARQMIERIEGSNRYRVTEEGLPKLLALVQLTEGIVDPLLTASGHGPEARESDLRQLAELETSYFEWHRQLQRVTEAINMTLQN